jgi:hypothetical protein
MPATPQLHAIAQKTCGKLFDYYAEFLVAGTYHRGDAASATVAFLIAPLPANLLFGAKVDPNDEQILIDATDMATLVNPQPGDYLVETASGLRRDVITAHLDLTRTMWTIIGRKVFA